MNTSEDWSKAALSQLADHAGVHVRIAAAFDAVRGVLWDFTPSADLGPDVAFTCARLASVRGDASPPGGRHPVPAVQAAVRTV